MKKRLLLLVWVLGIGTFVFGQANYKADFKLDTKPTPQKSSVDVPGYKQVAPLNNNVANSKGAISSVLISSSANIYTALVEQQTCMTADEGLGLLLATHRADPNVIGVSSGDIVSSTSEDGGDTWSSMVVLSNAAVFNHRYPSGTIYNPTGNTNPDNAFVTFCGPSHNGAATSLWDNNYFGSAQVDGTNKNVIYLPSYGALIRMGMETVGDKVHVSSCGYTDNDPTFTMDTIYLVTGAFNSTQSKFDWSTTKLTASFAKDANGSDVVYYWHFNTAWSSDGTIGYLWTIGRDSAVDVRSRQPLVWKTIDSGANWSQMPVFDFSTLPVITDRLQNMKGMTTSRPVFTTKVDGVVDANGDLHLVALVNAASSNHNDSLGYSFYVAGPDFANPIFDVHTTSTGWAAVYLGKTYTLDVAADESGYGTGTDATGWDLRLQAGRTTDGSKIFASWTDTDTNIAGANANGYLINLYPDIYVAGLDVITGKRTVATNFTLGTPLDADCYFHFMSNIILSNSGTYTIPMSKIDIGIDPLSPVNHKYVKGIEFLESDFVTNPGIIENSSSSFSVSQNYPNPFSGFTFVEITTDKSSPVLIEIHNVIGQKVNSTIETNLHAGTNSVKINCNDLEPGLYFYTITAGDSQVTKKMIIK